MSPRRGGEDLDPGIAAEGAPRGGLDGGWTSWCLWVAASGAEDFVVEIDRYAIAWPSGWVTRWGLFLRRGGLMALSMLDTPVTLFFITLSLLCGRFLLGTGVCRRRW